MNDSSGDQVRLFPYRLLLIGAPLLNLLHPIQRPPFMAPSSTITTFPHKNLQNVPASISLLCPAGIYDDAVPCAFWAATVSPSNNSYNSVDFSPGSRIFHDTRTEHVAMSACLLVALDNYDFTSDWELWDFSLITDLPAHCS
jgi:hypothetical protein